MNKGLYKAIKIDKDLWSIEDGFVRCFLLLGQDKAVLVDAGFSETDILSFVKGITNLPIFLVNTHADKDHIGGIGFFEETHMHPSEFDYFKTKSENNKIRLCPIWEGDVIDIGSWKLEVILLPGHTPGSIALLDTDRKVIIAGDSVQTDPVFMFGPGRNIEAYICSIEKLIKRKKEFDTIYSSHGQIEIKPDILNHLKDGAEKVLSGEIKGVKPQNPMPCLLYDSGNARFLY